MFSKKFEGFCLLLYFQNKSKKQLPYCQTYLHDSKVVIAENTKSVIQPAVIHIGFSLTFCLDLPLIANVPQGFFKVIYLLVQLCAGFLIISHVIRNFIVRLQ